MKICKTYILCALLSLFLVPQALAQSIVGAWSGGDTTKEDAGAIVFFANGTFVYIENVARSEAPGGFPGYERGTYTWNAATSAFTLNVLQDLNGNTGIGGASGLAGMTASISGSTLTINAPAVGTLVGTRVAGASPIVGAWGGASTAPDNSLAIVFFPNGVYFLAEDGDSSPTTGDPSGHDGIEIGTYSWNPTTGLITSSRTPAPYIDTNGEWGLSHVPATTTFKVFADGLTLAINDGTGTTSFPRAGGAAAVANYQCIWWNSPAESESGWGINFAHQGDMIFASWFTYDTNRHGWWLVMLASKSGPNTYTGRLLQTTGPAFSAPFGPGNPPSVDVGSGTLDFSDANTGTFTYTITSVTPNVTQTKTITRYVFGPAVPTCASAGTSSLALATNYQDLWWAAPGGSEAGWGINLNHQGDTIFATWYTYDVDGTPMWLVVSAPKSGPGMYSGDLYRESGARFDGFSKADTLPVKVGTATFTFTDGNHATFGYAITGVGPTPVTQSKPITRYVFNPPGTVCQ